MSSQRDFFLDSINPDYAPRMAPAVKALRQLLTNREWVERKAAITLMLEVSDLKRHTCINSILTGIKVGAIKKDGPFIAIDDWPVNL